MNYTSARNDKNSPVFLVFSRALLKNGLIKGKFELIVDKRMLKT